MSADGFEVVRGGAAPEDVAAVLAVLAALGESGASDQWAEDESGYAAWRRGRLAALARDGVARGARDVADRP